MPSDSESPGRVTLLMASLRGGGAERIMVTLANAFDARGVDVDLVVLSDEGPLKSLVNDRIRVFSFNTSRVSRSLLPLIRYIRQQRPASILSTMDHINVLAVTASRLSLVPVRNILRVANTMGERRGSIKDAVLVPLMTAILYRFAHVVVAVSDGVAEDTIKIARLQREKVKTIANPTLSEERLSDAVRECGHPWLDSGDLPVVVAAGRLTVEKDFATLLRAFSIVLEESKARLLVLGEGPERANLERLVIELNLGESVALPGFVEAPMRFMQKAEVFVLSSRIEGLPNALIEALSLGTKVVSTSCRSGPDEILENGRWGHLVPVGDEQSMARSISEALTESSIDGVIPYTRSKYSADGNADRYLDLLCPR